MTSLRLVCVALSQDFQYKGRAIQTNMLSPVVLTPPRTGRNPATSGHGPRAFAACSEGGRQTSRGVSGSRSAARLPACDCLHVHSNKHHHHPRPDASTGNCLGWMYSSRPLKERAVFESAVLVPRYISAPIPLGLALCFSRQRKRLLTPFHIVNVGRPLQSPRALPLTCPTLSHGRLGIREGPATDAAKARA